MQFRYSEPPLDPWRVKKWKFRGSGFVEGHMMIGCAGFGGCGVGFGGGDTFCVKTQITENDPILKYIRYREK